MCTAISYENGGFYFGRNLDLEYSFKNEVTITPRKYKFKFKKEDIISNHYAMIGTSIVVNDYPLYFDAVNEKGLGIAGLNFKGFAVYKDFDDTKINITPFELIPYLLSKYSSVSDVKSIIKDINIINISFSDEFSLSPLHWLISDEKESIVLESVKEGLKVYQNKFCVLTNNPPFDYHYYNMSNYMNLTSNLPVNRFSDKINLDRYSTGIGGVGLPGDLSSVSRFVRAAYVRLNSVCEKEENANVSQFFHMLDDVAQTRGCSLADEERYEVTQYSSCFSLNTKTYYYKTYDNNQINAISMNNINLDSDDLYSYKFIEKQNINFQN